MHIVSNKWVSRTKFKANGTVDCFKARLVAKGFQQTLNVDYFETFNPIIKPSTIRIVFTLVVTHQWSIQQIDVNNAFLNGDLQEIIYMAQPEGFVDQEKPIHVCKLVKALYGLKQAPRAWFEKLKSFLVQWGFPVSNSHTSLFFCKKQSKLLMVLIYVDDILVIDDDSTMISQVIIDLGNQFTLKTQGEVNHFLGFEACTNSTSLVLTQTKYIHDLLIKTNMNSSKPCSNPICLNQKPALNNSKSFDLPSLYRSTVMALQYLTMTRPNISFAVNKLNQFVHAPTNNHWSTCKRILRYLQAMSTIGL